jgi:hypothetical protein
MMAILANDGTGEVCVEAEEDSRVLIIAGQPLNEPIAQRGPFVMNTDGADSSGHARLSRRASSGRPWFKPL